jgi:hypothetical protein
MQNYRTMNMMSKALTASLLLLILFWMAAPVQAQEYDGGVGLRVGDPFGLSYKKYRDTETALEFILGASGTNWHTSYYRKSYDRISKFDNFLYDGHRVDYSIALGGRFLWQKNFNEDVDGFQWYYGAGLQMRFASVEYTLIDRSLVTDANDIFTANRQFDTHYNVDIGPEGIIGLEYTLYDAPLTLFMETSLFAEVVDNPFSFRFFGALGMRINFRR